MSDFEKDLLQLQALGDEYDVLMEKAKAVGAQYDELSWKLATEMEASNRGTVTLYGYQFIPTQKVYSKVEDKAAFDEWVRANDMWDVTHMVSAQKINAYCNELMEAKKETPPGVNPGLVKHTISIRRVS